MKKVKRMLAWSCAASMLLSGGMLSAFCEEPNRVSVNYTEYRAEQTVFAYGEPVKLTAGEISEKTGDTEIVADVGDSGTGGVVIPDDGAASWRFTVATDSSYCITVKYMSAEASSGNLEVQLNVDGEIPFTEATLVSFERWYEQESGEFQKNSNGNEIKPDVNEIFVWKEKAIVDSSGYRTEPFVFDFSAGEHTLTLKGSRGKIAIAEIILSAPEELKTYKEYEKEIGQYASQKGESVEIEAEHVKYKNSVTVLPVTDRSSAATTPQSESALLLNCMGGDNWKSIGNAATWEIEIEKSGVYEIATRFLQNVKDGIFTCRKLYIDGKVPFREAKSIRFDYSSDWQCEKLGDQKGAYRFYLEKGKHTFTLEATAGEVADMIGTVSQSITELNRINRRIKLITGNKVDVNRDYNFAGLIPEEVKQLGKIKEDLQKQVEFINEQAGANGSFVAILQKVIFQLEKMSANPRTIPKYLTRFQSNLGAMGEWLLSATEQPLKLDKIYVQPAGRETPKATPSFFGGIGFGIRSFLCSFSTDYSTIGSQTEDGAAEELTVWVQTGRDQGQVIRELIDATFEEKINIKIQVVSSGLLQSVLAGISPDVVTNCAETLPLEYALRNAVQDMTEFPDYEEVFSRFSKASVKPATFGGKVYGMPQTYSFFMMFYRTDIFNEFGYTVPTTWEELKNMIPSLQRNGMEVGIPHGLDMYATVLYQNGGELYQGDGKATNLSDYTSIVSFADLTEFFTLYDCPVTYNFANRFRSGEIPVAIVPYTEYNQLTAFAPEIKGMWKMVPIPGTEREDGSVSNTAVGNASFAVIMRSSKHKDAAWKFLKWFMSAETQSSYAIRMESILGTCAKVDSANVEALSKMTWSSSEYKELFAQMDHIDSVPQVPGGYYLSRIVGFAFNRVYNQDENPKEVLRDYIKELNDELTRKRAEFGLAEE